MHPKQTLQSLGANGRQSFRRPNAQRSRSMPEVSTGDVTQQSDSVASTSPVSTLKKVLARCGQWWWTKAMDECPGRFANEPFYLQEFDASTRQWLWEAAIREGHRYIGVILDLKGQGYDVDAPTGHMEVGFLEHLGF